ncbi:hypothetical protein Sme01_68410 [Sphaerisporangium melleum]|uniref:Uncharacterized protein n=1 Tax=Sphaerisporangium melleum TaxID=321316 RepID=A0A917RJU7_9ACTN|nr:DUF5988 family protein [Sphaerisporangium melleum]GGL11959.1 hypothetical protein GCM10007964_62440 [Sphaerisporangium melleum]GII74365.1 hypothetical protein Sme01_68410 [Sphaerisporangium melleum]
MTHIQETHEAPAGCAISADGGYDVNIVLVGGPADFLDTARFRLAGTEDQKVKILHKSGYEHFERTAEHYHMDGDCQGLIYRWTTSTRIAE